METVMETVMISQSMKDLLQANNISLSDLCDRIRRMDGNRAWVIYQAKNDGWWIGDACADIRDTGGDDVAWAICMAKEAGWWVEGECND